MRACTFITVLLALFVTESGCSRGPKLTSKIQAAGGATALQTECAGFIRIFEESKEQSYTWMPHDTNFPPAIASFSPQAVSVTRQDGVLLVDVHVTGGFMHHGLLIAPSPTPATFKPQMSSWPIWQITNGVWEYRE
jgi:hypothetical protein